MALAGHQQESPTVMLAGRNEAALSSIAFLGRVRAAALGCAISISLVACDYSKASLEQLFAQVRPRIVLMLASMQSPWDMRPRWRRLVQATGYSLTIPLQTILAESVFRMAQLQHPHAILINGCYPDIVNHVLLKRGIKLDGGIGNVAILASVLQTFYPNRALRLIAHHAHIAAMISGTWEGVALPHIWLDNLRVPEDRFGKILRSISLPSDRSLNAVTGSTAVPMLEALAGRSSSWHGHAPGVHGLVGGYPVFADSTGLHLDIPHELSLDEAIALNREYCRCDGLVIQDDTYRLAKTADEIKCATGVQLPHAILEWKANGLEDQVGRLISLRLALNVETG